MAKDEEIGTPTRVFTLAVEDHEIHASFALMVGHKLGHRMRIMRLYSSSQSTKLAFSSHSIPNVFLALL
jgi:hypothetical protein